MRRISLAVLVLCAAVSSKAQGNKVLTDKEQEKVETALKTDEIAGKRVHPKGYSYDSTWHYGGIFGLNFSQVSLRNWAGGGQNSITVTSLAGLYAKYKKGNVYWDNALDLEYGLFTDDPKFAKFYKSSDRIELNSKLGIKANDHLSYSGLLNFLSQFDVGYASREDSIYISRFLAPGYVLVALGMDYKPNDKFSMFVSPATAKFTIVNDKRLSDAGAYGVDSGSVVRSEIGGYLKIGYEDPEIFKNVGLKTNLGLFSNYLKNPQNIDVNYDLRLDMKINKYMTANFTLQMMYDHDVNITEYGKDGTTVIGFGPRLQIKQMLAAGLAYKF